MSTNLPKITSIECSQCGSDKAEIVIVSDDGYIHFDKDLKVVYSGDSRVNKGDSLSKVIKTVPVEDYLSSCPDCEDEVFANIHFDDGSMTSDSEEAVKKVLGKSQSPSQISQNQNPSCSSCPSTNPNPTNPNPTPTPVQPTQPKPVPQNSKAICPRCGTKYDILKPVLKCKECGLRLGELDEEGELDWNEMMKEPFPDFANIALPPDEIFAKTIEWYYEKWVKVHKTNPSHKIGKIE